MKHYYTAAQAIERLQISRSTFYHLLKTGVLLPGTVPLLSTQAVYDKDAIDELAKRRLGEGDIVAPRRTGYAKVLVRMHRKADRFHVRARLKQCFPLVTEWYLLDDALEETPEQPRAWLFFLPLWRSDADELSDLPPEPTREDIIQLLDDLYRTDACEHLSSIYYRDGYGHYTWPW